MFRKMRRINQQISDEKCIEILKNEPRGFLAVLGDSGYPYSIPLNHYYEDGKLYFHCAKEGHKIDAIKNNNKVSYCVIDKGTEIEGKRGLDFNSVIVFGKMSILEDKNKIIEYVRKIGLKFFGLEPTYIENEIEKYKDKVNIIVLEIENMTGKRVNES
ncbi:MAG: pyridoxamine 5'-phosphate oxidase family protein [Lachnospirales bacterium]